MRHLLLVSLLVCGVLGSSYPPEQVHVALGQTPDHVRAQWTTTDHPTTTATVVKYGLSATHLDHQVTGEHFTLKDTASNGIVNTQHVAKLTGLKASTVYYYQVGDPDKGMSTSTFRFRTMPDATTVRADLPMRMGVYGDQGTTNAQSLPLIKQEVAEHNFTMIYHIGDMAYDMNSDGGRNGDAYMRDLEPVAANVPYMTTLGNHEAAQNFNHYTQRFRSQPSNSGNVTMKEFGIAPNNWYFSWNAGLVHFVTISTEIYFDYKDMVQKQWEWVEQDLKAANANRSQAPWIIVGGHRPLYCSCDGDCDGAATAVRMGQENSSAPGGFQWGMEDLFYRYGVDVYICGHEHDYERMYEVSPWWNKETPWLSGKTTQSTTDMKATTYVVTGSAGCREDHEAFTRPQPKRSALRSNTYGYSRMTIYNETHIHWEQVMTDSGQPKPDMGKVIDDVWWVQHHHGPFTSTGEERSEIETTHHHEGKTMDVIRDGTSKAVYGCRKGQWPCNEEMGQKGMWAYDAEHPPTV